MRCLFYKRLPPLQARYCPLATNRLCCRLEEENSEEGIKRVRAVLSDFEIKVVEYVLKGYSKNAEIAELMNKDAKSIDNAKQRILNKLQNTEQNND